MKKAKKEPADVLMPRLTYQQLMTMWAALCVIQEVLYDPGVCNHDESSVRSMEHFDEVEPLTSEQIDQLCEDLALGPHNVKQRDAALKQARKALRGDSNDDEHDALYEMVEAFDCWPDNPNKPNPPKE